MGMIRKIHTGIVVALFALVVGVGNGEKVIATPKRKAVT
jgi:hypothetical protein